MSGPAERRCAGAGGAVLWRAAAKLNLSLRVLGRRADGFHDLDSVVARITLYDDLTVTPRADGRIRLECTGADCGPAEENLVVRAARLVAGGKAYGADIRLGKRIPPGAGLGGGSSDAATGLLALNELWGVGAGDERLGRWAGELGSDVALFLSGPAVRMRGRGLRLDPLTMPPFHAIVTMPDIHCPTGQVYAAHDAAPPAPSAAGERWRRMVDSGAMEGPPSAWREGLVNDLAAAAVRVRPALAEVIDRLREGLGVPVHVTGSGSAVFALFDTAREALSAAAGIPREWRSRSRVAGLNPW